MIKCQFCNKKTPINFLYFCQHCLRGLPKSQEEALNQLAKILEPFETKIMKKHHELYNKFGAHDERTLIFDKLSSVLQVYHMIYFMWEISFDYHPKFSKNNIPSIYYQLDNHYSVIKPTGETVSGVDLFGKFNQFLGRSFDVEFIFQLDSSFRRLNKIMKNDPTNSFESLTKNIIKNLEISINAAENPILLLSTIRNLKHEDSVYNQNTKNFQIDKYNFKFVKNQKPEFDTDLFCQVYIADKCIELLEKITDSEKLDKILKFASGIQ